MNSRESVDTLQETIIQPMMLPTVNYAKDFEPLERLSMLINALGAIIEERREATTHNWLFSQSHREPHLMMLDSIKKDITARCASIKVAKKELAQAVSIFGPTYVPQAEETLRVLTESLADSLDEYTNRLEWMTKKGRDYTYKVSDRKLRQSDSSTRYYKYSECTFIYKSDLGDETSYVLHGLLGPLGGSSLAESIKSQILNNANIQISGLSQSLRDEFHRGFQLRRHREVIVKNGLIHLIEPIIVNNHKLQSELQLKDMEVKSFHTLSIFSKSARDEAQAKLVEVDAELKAVNSQVAELKVENHELKTQVSRSLRSRRK